MMLPPVCFIGQDYLVQNTRQATMKQIDNLDIEKQSY
jgi:hypothetical protein